MRYTASKSTDKMIIAMRFLSSAREHLSEANLDWKEINVNGDTFLLPTLDMKFKDGTETKKVVDEEDGY